MICPRCNNQMPDNLSECTRCGFKIIQGQTPMSPIILGDNKIQCPKCGRILPSSAKTCLICKTKFTFTNVQPQSVQQQPQPQVVSNHNQQMQYQSQSNGPQVQQIPNYQQQYNVKPKKSGTGCVVAILVVLGIIFILGIIPALFRYINKDSNNSNVSVTTQDIIITEDTPIIDTTTEAISEQISFAETTIYDENDIKIVVSNYQEIEGEPIFDLKVINNSNEDFEIDPFYMTVNGIMENAGPDERLVLSGKTLTDKIHISKSSFDIYKIDVIYNIALKIVLISDNNTYVTDLCSFDLRNGNQTFSDELIYENEVYSVYKISSSSDLTNNKIRIFNKSDETLSCSINDTSINDVMCNFDIDKTMGYGLWTYSMNSIVFPQNSIIFDINIDSTQLTEKNISTINNIEFKIDGQISDTKCVSEPIILEK